jgi:hypothetical protein
MNGNRQEQSVPSHPSHNNNSIQTSNMVTSGAERLDLLVASFCSLLSSAHTNGVHHALMPHAESNRSISNLLSYSASNGGGQPGNTLSGICSLPCLKLRNAMSPSNGRIQNVSLHDVMALNLSTQIKVNRNSINEVPKMLLKNVASSFQDLISSRLRVSLQAITKTILKIGGEGTDARVLRRLLTSSSPVKITTVVTSFQVGPDNNDRTDKFAKSVSRPLAFDTIVDVSIFGKMYTITLEAPGTITATLSSVDYLLDRVNVAFDTVTLLKAMMTQARAIVKKTVKRAATITTTVTNFQQSKPSSVESSSSDKTSKKDKNNANATPQDNLLASYPEHLRETVEHFLPAVEMEDTVNVEGFPPNLLQTLQSLSNGNDSGDGDSQSSGSQDVKKQVPQIHQGLFSWMNSDDMMLRQPNSSSRRGSNGDISSCDSLASNFSQRKRSLENLYSQNAPMQPLSRRNKKVSFSLPSRI